MKKSDLSPLEKAAMPSPDVAGVLAWRAKTLCDAGFSPAEAFELAERRDVDLHRTVEMVKGGCPVETALRILR